MFIEQEAKNAKEMRKEPMGVAAANAFAQNPSSKPKPRVFEEFAMNKRVGIVTGGNRGLGLEFAAVLCEGGAIVHCIDLPKEPSQDWLDTEKFAKGLGTSLHYHSMDVTNQAEIWKLCAEIGEKEGRFDFAVCAAGILPGETDCWDTDANTFAKVMDVNANGVFYSAQAASRQMKDFGNGGSIILVASMSGSVVNKGGRWASYNISKSAVIQMARSMACELAPFQIRVNSLSPGHIRTNMTATLLDTQPELLRQWSELNPMNRIGMIHELRGVVTFLASDASTFCTGSDLLISGGHTFMQYAIPYPTPPATPVPVVLQRVKSPRQHAIDNNVAKYATRLRRDKMTQLEVTFTNISADIAKRESRIHTLLSSEHVELSCFKNAAKMLLRHLETARDLVMQQTMSRQDLRDLSQILLSIADWRCRAFASEEKGYAQFFKVSTIRNQEIKGQEVAIRGLLDRKRRILAEVGLLLGGRANDMGHENLKSSRSVWDHYARP